VAFYSIKKNKLWIIKAVDRDSRRTIAWALGNRDTTTFTRLYDTVKHLTHCLFYTDNWDAFAKILPKERHIIGKAHTITIQQDNSNTRHHLARMTRRTKVVSKSLEMLNTSLKLWCALTQTDFFSRFQARALSIFE
jgi:insertion element IS1 protein InsB